MYWNFEIETQSNQKLKDYQLTQFNQTIRRINQSHFYQILLKEKKINIKAIEKLIDIQYFPFTTLKDISQHSFYDLLAVDRNEVVRVITKVGIHGSKRYMFYTQNDIENSIQIAARSLYAANVRNTDVFQNICRYNSDGKALGYQLGAEKIGAMVIGSGQVSWKKQLQLMHEFGTTVIYTHSDNIQPLLNSFYDSNIDPRIDSELKTVIVENRYPLNDVRQKYKNQLGVECFLSYGINALFDPIVSIECSEHSGMHIWEDYFLAEIINPKTLQPVSDGEWGELVLTTLQHEAMPLLRFRTGDITRFITSPCLCGRTHVRIDNIKGRVDDEFYFKGQCLQPIQFEKVLNHIPELGENYQIYLNNSEGIEEMIIEIEVVDELCLDNYGKLERLTQYIIQEIENETQIRPKIRLVEPNYFKVQSKELKKIIDNRKYSIL